MLSACALLNRADDMIDANSMLADFLVQAQDCAMNSGTRQVSIAAWRVRQDHDSASSLNVS